MNYVVGFEVFTAVVLKSIFFWDMTLCCALSGTRRFGGTYRLHLQGRRIVQQSSEQASGKWCESGMEVLGSAAKYMAFVFIDKLLSSLWPLE
jgi:hypothetical protein